MYSRITQKPPAQRELIPTGPRIKIQQTEKGRASIVVLCLPLENARIFRTVRRRPHLRQGILHDFPPHRELRLMQTRDPIPSSGFSQGARNRWSLG